MQLQLLMRMLLRLLPLKRAMLRARVLRATQFVGKTGAQRRLVAEIARLCFGSRFPRSHPAWGPSDDVCGKGKRFCMGENWLFMGELERLREETYVYGRRRFVRRGFRERVTCRDEMRTKRRETSESKITYKYHQKLSFPFLKRLGEGGKLTHY